MKKLFSSLFILVLIAACAAFIASCDKNVVDDTKEFTVTFETNGGSTVEAQKVKEGEKAVEPTAPTKENYTFEGWYSDSKLTDKYNFDTAVTKDTTLFAGWEEVEQKLTLVLSVSMNSNILAHESNKSEQDNKRTEFYDRTQEFLVGDDNNFVVKPAVSFISYNTKTKEVTPIVVSSWSYNITVLVKGTDGVYVNTDETLVEAIDKVAGAVNFSEAAVGKTFKIEVYPDGLTEKQLESLDEYRTSVEVTVVDGYNAYTALDLAYIDYRKDNGLEDQAWSAFKAEKGLDSSLHPASILLQSNISITANDIPSFFVYQEEELSKSDSDYERTLHSLKDDYEIYVRNLGENESFTLCGNYFTLSASSLPVVTRESGKITPEGEVISHATLIRFNSTAANVTATIENVTLIGNAPRVEDTIKAGGIILNKVTDVDFRAYNNLATGWFIVYFPNNSYKTYTVEKCKAYDSFNSFIYCWGSTIAVSDSEFIGAGGPIIIQDHIRTSDPDGGTSSSTSFTNCVLQSYVVGSEGWFTVVKASALVPQIKALDAYFNPFGRSFLKTNADGSLTYMNLICVNKSGSAQSITAEKIEGSIAINSAVFDYGKTANPYLAGLLEQTFSLGAPAFQSSEAALNDGIAYGTQTGLFDVTNNQIMDPSNKLFSGDYLSLYYSGMMFTLGYGPVGEKIPA